MDNKISLRAWFLTVTSFLATVFLALALQANQPITIECPSFSELATQMGGSKGIVFSVNTTLQNGNNASSINFHGQGGMSFVDYNLNGDPIASVSVDTVGQWMECAYNINVAIPNPPTTWSVGTLIPSPYANYKITAKGSTFILTPPDTNPSQPAKKASVLTEKKK